jgi:hypothetical protein
VFKWFKQARANNIPLNRPIIQEKAMEFVTDLKFMDFKASNGWLESWRSRFSIGFFKVCGESADVDDNVVDDFRSKIGKIVEGYKAEDIFNADETGLFFKALPDKTLAPKGEACKGGKLAKERITCDVALSRNSKTFHKFIYFCNPFSENVRGHQCFFFYCKIHGDCQCLCF